MKDFKKEYLKTGMKIVSKSGEESIVLVNTTSAYTNDVNIVVVNPVDRSWSWTADIEAELSKAVKILIPEHPYDIFYTHKGWKVIWQRVEKSPEQKKVEELETTIAQAQAQLAQLKQQINKGE